MKILSSVLVLSLFVLVAGCSTTTHDQNVDAYGSTEPSNSYYHPSEKVKKSFGAPAERAVSSAHGNEASCK